MKVAKIHRPENGSGEGTVTLTATITKGSVTATKLFNISVREQGLSDTQCVAVDKAALDISGKDAVKATILLPDTGINGTTVTWVSGTPAVVSNLGAVTRPANGANEVDVVMTATIKKGSITDTKTITVKVLPWTDDEEIEMAFDALTWDVIRNSNISDQNITNNLLLSTSGSKGTSISWASSNDTFVTTGGVITRPSYVDGDLSFSLSATITKGAGVPKIKQFLSLKLTKLPQTNTEAVTTALAAMVDSVIKGTNASLTQVTDALVLPKVSDASVDARSVVFTYSQVKQGGSVPSTFLTIVDNGAVFSGNVTRPSSASVNEQITLTVTASSTTAAGVNYTGTKTFAIIILKA